MNPFQNRQCESNISRIEPKMGPLSKSQEKLRGERVVDMTNEQLVDWIDACNKMEQWIKAAKARRSWKRGRQEALEELERRTK
jgi:hypothetical protein